MGMSDHIFKVLIIGDSGVGKSCILKRYTDNEYEDSFLSTIGVDLRIKNLLKGNNRIKLQIWDTAGQERFQTITSNYYRNSKVVIIVYDITDKESFYNLNKWIEQCNQFNGEKVLKIIVGNKIDSENKREIDRELVNNFCKSNNLFHIETSAKNSEKIDELFEHIIEELTKNIETKTET